jgi:hypothetical protein
MNKARRLAYFDEAEGYTPYLATRAGEALFLVKTEDKHIARSLFGKQARGELSVLGRAAAAVRGLFSDAHVAEGMFVDVGANIGTTSIPAVISEGFASALAIEPEPENVRVLRLNVLERKRSGRERETLTVKTVTVDSLAEHGVIDVERTGLMWIDAEAHEGHILAGATSLLERGTPLVLEWNPSNLDKVGDRGRLQDAVAEHYTHFAAMHRNINPNQPSFPLQTADRLPAYAERFLNPENFLTKTDILVLRLTEEQAASVRSLDEFVRTRAYESDESSSDEEDGSARPPLLRRLFRRP